MKTSEGRVDAFKFLLPAIQRIGDKLERAAIANDVAGYLGVEPGLVLDQFKRSATDRKATPKQTAGVSIPALERILLTALLSSAAARAEVLPQLSAEAIAGFTAREVFESISQLEAAGSAATVSSLDARLTGQAKALLHEIAAADEMSDEILALEQARSCLRRVEEAIKEKRIEELRIAIQAAEREDRWDDALDLLTQLGKLQKRAGGNA